MYSAELLGDPLSEGLVMKGGLRSSLGSDTIGGIERWDFTNELYAGVGYGDAQVEAAVPITFRTMGGETLTGFGDVAVRGSVELVRFQNPASSDTLRLMPVFYVAPTTGPRVWQWSLSTQAVTPQMGLGFRHSAEQWAVSATAFAALPIALKDSVFTWGPSAGVGASVEYAPWQWFEGKLALDFHHQWAASDAGAPILDSQVTSLFAGVEARVRPIRKFAIAAALSQPLFSLSPGQNVQSRVYRLGVELAL